MACELYLNKKSVCQTNANTRTIAHPDHRKPICQTNLAPSPQAPTCQSVSPTPNPAPAGGPLTLRSNTAPGPPRRGTRAAPAAQRSPAVAQPRPGRVPPPRADGAALPSGRQAGRRGVPSPPVSACPELGAQPHARQASRQRRQGSAVAPQPGSHAGSGLHVSTSLRRLLRLRRQRWQRLCGGREAGRGEKRPRTRIGTERPGTRQRAVPGRSRRAGFWEMESPRRCWFPTHLASPGQPRSHVAKSGSLKTRLRVLPGWGAGYLHHLYYSLHLRHLFFPGE